MREHPRIRTLVLGGYFDLASPLAATLFAIRHAGVPASRTEVLPLVAGHSLDDDGTLATAASALRTLIRTTSQGRTA